MIIEKISTLFVICVLCIIAVASPRSPADFNGDGIVNLIDYRIFMDHWLLGASDIAIDQNTGRKYTELNDALDKMYLAYNAAQALKQLVNQDPNSREQELVKRIICLTGWSHLDPNMPTCPCVCIPLQAEPNA